MFMKEYLTHCTACGGNWGAMLLSGVSKVFPDEYSEVKEHYNSMDFKDGGVRAFSYLCDWLTEHGIFPDENNSEPIEPGKRIIVEQLHDWLMKEFDFATIEKGKGIYETVAFAELSVGVSYEDSSEGNDIYIYNIFVGDEYVNISARGNKKMPLTIEVLKELVDAWNGFVDSDAGVKRMSLFEEE